MKIDAATFEVIVVNHSQDFTKKQLQEQLTIPTGQQTVLRDTCVEKFF